MIDATRFKLLFAFMTMFLAVCYPIVKPYLETYLDNLNENTVVDNFGKYSIESEIIRSWDRLVVRPKRKQKNLKVAIG